MKDTRPLQEQIAEMTEEQKDKIIKVGKVAQTVQLVGGIPLFILSLLAMWVIYKPPLGFDMTDYDRLFVGAVIIWVITLVYFLGVLLYVKIKYPEYSDKKWNYINKERKARKK